MCAAPGGKSAYMAELMDDEGDITACDIHDHRLELIKKTQTMIHDTSSIWKGKDNQELVTKIDSFQPQLLKIKSIMEQYAAYLNSCAIQYNQLQQERMMAARRLA